jgi:hypothetical protein
MEGWAMKMIKPILLFLALTGLLAANVWAGPRGWPHAHPRSSVQFGIHIGVPFGYPPPYVYYPYPVYAPRIYVPPVVPIVVAPPVYIEQPGAVVPATSALEVGYWYYCQEAQAYYPYVKQCPGGWQKVAPQPAQ